MNRRKFFSFLAPIAAVPAVALTASVSVGDTVHYRGCVLRWTGYKETAESLRLTGQWFARRTDGRLFRHPQPSCWGYEHLVVTTGGVISLAGVGYDFTQQLRTDCPTTHESSKAELERVRLLTLDELKREIDRHYQEGLI